MVPKVSSFTFGQLPKAAACLISRPQHRFCDQLIRAELASRIASKKNENRRARAETSLPFARSARRGGGRSIACDAQAGGVHGKSHAASCARLEPPQPF